MATEWLRADFAARAGDFRLAPRFEVTARVTALFGPSGAGKTSTLHVLAGLLRPESGQLHLRERCLFDISAGVYVPASQRRVGLVFQDGRLFPHRSVEANLMFGLARTPAGERRFTFDEIVEILGIASLLGRFPATLSGGETQRVAIGRALLASPELLLLDEPLAAVDQPARLALLTHLRQISELHRLPILYVSHDLGAVLNIADEVVLMQEGAVAGQGSPYEVLADYVSKPLTPNDAIRNPLRVLIESHDANAGTSRVTAGAVSLTLPLLEGERGKSLWIDVPAAEIILATSLPKGLSARNILAGKVIAVTRLGNRVLARVDAKIPLSVEIVESTVAGLGLRSGKRVYLVIKATAVRLLNW